MAAFRFRLASLLRYREQIREERKRELYTFQEARDHLASEIMQLELLLTGQRKELEGQAGKLLSIVDLRLYGDFFQQVAQKIREKLGLLATADQRLLEKRGEVVQADRGVKTIEQLRHRYWQKHRQQENREEQKMIDEVGQRGYLDRKRI